MNATTPSAPPPPAAAQAPPDRRRLRLTVLAVIAAILPMAFVGGTNTPPGAGKRCPQWICCQPRVPPCGASGCD